MYEIERTRVRTTTVYRLTFSGFVTVDEMARWVEDSREALRTAPSTFCVQVDMRGLKPLPAAAQQVMEQGQALYKQAGMARSAVLLDNTLIKLQFERLARQSGIHEWERYFSAEEPEADASIERWIVEAA